MRNTLSRPFEARRLLIPSRAQGETNGLLSPTLSSNGGEGANAEAALLHMVRGSEVALPGLRPAVRVDGQEATTLVRGPEVADPGASAALSDLQPQGAVGEGSPKGAHGRSGPASTASQRGLLQVVVRPESEV